MTRRKKAIKACGLDRAIEVYDFGAFIEVTGTVGGDVVRYRVYFNDDGSIDYITER